jgi:hypothetical protein
MLGPEFLDHAGCHPAGDLLAVKTCVEAATSAGEERRARQFTCDRMDR